MTLPQVEVQLIAAVVALSCTFPGVFLVLRRMAMISDALSHAMLLGIVLAFFLTHDLNSPFLIAGASLAGLVTALLVELVRRTGLVREDAAIGLVFPAFFSLGVVLIARAAGSVHLDTDVVVLGELAFAPFERFTLAGRDLGPQALVVSGVVLLLNALLVTLFFKELKLTTFDPVLAATLGFSPALFHYGLLAVTAVTAVTAFEAVGAILTVALFIAPPTTALLLTDDLGRLVVLSAAFAVSAALVGYWVAHVLDASIAGSMATVTGALFAAVWLFVPERGLVARVRRRLRQRQDFAVRTLLVHLLGHESGPLASGERSLEHLWREFHWDERFARRVVSLAERRGLVTRQNDALLLTPRGKALAEQSLLLLG